MAYKKRVNKKGNNKKVKGKNSYIYADEIFAHGEKVLKDISFITTIYNEEGSILSFLESLFSQEFLPGEVVIVDGGSVDNTLKIVLDFFIKKINKINNKVNSKFTGNKYKDNNILVKVMEKKGANISRGRNIAIKNTINDIVCVSDAGCILGRKWVTEVTKFVRENYSEVSCGFNYPLCGSLLESSLAMCIMPKKDEIKKEKFMPSSRNISFRKSVWESVGGYPEDMDYGEDMKFNFNLKAKGYKLKFNPDAEVFWKMRGSIIDIFRQFFRYAKGDAIGKMYIFRHIIRFFCFILIIAIFLLAFNLSFWFFISFIFLFTGYVYKPYRRLNYIWSECSRDIKKRNFKKILSIFIVPVLLFYIDAAKIFGYIYGLAAKKVYFYCKIISVL